MKIQFAVVLKDRHGVDFTEPDPIKSTIGQPPVMKAISLGDICCAVLDVAFQDENTEGLKPKLRRAELLEKISAADKSLTPLELLDADIEMLKERIGKRNFPPSMTLAAVRLLVPVPEPAE